ncbi:MAG: carbohydrate ABC transporter substrate-binding protein [Clostridiales bacterium]|nr:carbohydrate ABC transporter substrate-binding protein [Clostridiales bacterium]
MKSVFSKWIVWLLVLLCTCTSAFAAAETLKIQGIYFNPKTLYSEENKSLEAQWYAAFTSAYPDNKLSPNKKMPYQSTKSLQKALEKKEFKTDVFTMDTLSHDHRQIIAEGLCVDLSQYEAVMDVVAQIHPSLMNAVTYDGKVYGVPLCVSPRYFYYDKNVWELAGLAETDVPASYTGFLDFLEGYCEGIRTKPIDNVCIYSFDDDNYGPTAYTNWLLELLIGNYVDQCEFQGMAVQFSTSEFIALLERTKTVGELLYQYDDIKDSEALFSDRTGELRALGQLIPLRMTDDDPIFIKSEMKLCAVSAASKNAEQAASFLAFFMNNLRSHTCDVMKQTTEDADYLKAKADLFSDTHEAVPSQNYGLVDFWQQKIEEGNAVLADPATDELTRKEYEENVIRWQYVLGKVYDQEYYATKEQLDTYHSLVECFYFASPDGFDSISSEITAQRKQFSTGSITAEKLAQRLDDLVK